MGSARKKSHSHTHTQRIKTTAIKYDYILAILCSNSYPIVVIRPLSFCSLANSCNQHLKYSLSLQLSYAIVSIFHLHYGKQHVDVDIA